jgi:small-conductance mechanosensitive channel
MLTVLAWGGCTLPGRDRATDVVADSTSAADSLTAANGPIDSAAAALDSTGAQVVAGDSAAGTTPVAVPDTLAPPALQVVPDSIIGLGTGDAAAAGAFTELAIQVGRLVEGQAAINRRLDSIGAGTRAGSTAQVGGAGAAASSGEVLGQAGESVRSFGVGVVWSAIVILIFNLIIRGSVWLLDTLSERNPTRRLFYKRLVPIVRIVLWIFAAYLIVRVIFQVNAQGFLAATAAVGVAIGFAAQDLIKNLFGGLILVFDQPFQVGDKISVGGTYGEVVSIGLRSTRLVTPDDNLVSVPNSQVVDQQVANANAGELNCQVVTDLFLPGWADEDAAKRIAFNAAASSKYVYLSKPIVVLIADQFKETFLTRVRVKAYVMDPRYEFLLQSDVTERARAGFREAGLLTPDHLGMYLVRHSSVPDAFDPRGAAASDPEGDDDRA